MKKILVLPGSSMQLPLVKRLKDRGYHIISFHPTSSFPTQQYSDEYDIADILDFEKCLKLARKYKPDVILSEECDIAMPTIAYISDILGLYSLSVTDAALYTDKSLMREFCNRYKIDSPAYRKCLDKSEAKEFYSQYGGKCILKPLDSNCSKGVFIITEKSDIDKYWDESIIYSKCSQSLLIEEYIEGTEFTIDGIVTKYGHKSLAISEKKHYDYNPNIAYELLFRNYHEDYNYEELRKINNFFVDTSSLPIGFFTHAEYKFRNGRFYLIEIGARGGGNYISSDIVPIVSGFDNYNFMINALVEGNLDTEVIIDEIYNDRCAVLYFFDIPNSGVVRKIDRLDVLSNNPNVIRYDLKFNIGDRIERANNDSARIGYYIAYADNISMLRTIMDNINKSFKIIIE